MAKPVPESVVIVGSGVFGLSTAWALTKRPEFSKTSITVIDDVRGGEFPPGDCASVDSSRIIRADYSDPHYSALAAVAQREWRKQSDEELGGQGRYSESGLVLTADHPKSPLAGNGKLTGMDYTRNSWKNVAKIAQDNGFPAGKVRALENPEALQAVVKTQQKPGDWGYINELSGWADAGRGMQWLYKKVEATGRVNFIDAKVTQLVTEGNRVVGAQLDDKKVIKGDLVYVAAGAWTGQLVDMRGRTEATGHVLGYVDISQDELDTLSKQPVVLNLSTGLFIIPPQSNVLKVARHSYGYLNPVTVETALPPSPAHPRVPIVTSLPMTTRNGGQGMLPAEADVDLRKGLVQLSPVKGLESRPWKETRICWYSDTIDGDWVVDYHPGWEGLFIATGDSGHGYKFLPVLGDKILDCILGNGGELGHKWRWKDISDNGVGRVTNGKFVGLGTEDGSRSGAPGMILQDELNKGEGSKL